MDLNDTPEPAVYRRRVRSRLEEHKQRHPGLRPISREAHFNEVFLDGVQLPPAARAGRPAGAVRDGEVRHRFGEIAAEFLALRFDELVRAAA